MDFARVARAFARVGIPVLGALLVLVSTAPASAATLTINKNAITRRAPLRSDPITRNWINLSECQSGDVMTFPLVLSDYYGTQLEVWVTEGTGDCTAREARTTTNATCWRVFRTTPTTNVPNVEIKVQDIAAKKRPPQYEDSVGTAADCVSTTTAAQQITLYFMLISSLDNQGGEAWPTSMDLLGPNPPAGLKVGAGSQMLRAEWSANNDTDVAAYQFFCDPPPGVDTTNVDSSFGPGPRTDGSSGTGSVCPDASVTTDDSGAEDGGIEDASADACTPGSTGGGNSTGVGACAASAITPNVVPDVDFANKYRCGDTTGKSATSTLIQGLVNFQPTTVAISAVDAVGNAGPLSNAICGIPKPVNGFDELYTKAGGSADDGICSLRRLGARERMSFSGAALLALPLLVARRRRSRTKPL